MAPDRQHQKTRDSWLIVDGYNIVGAWEEFRDLASEDLSAARDALQDLLLDYCGHSGQRLLLVFDAHSGKQGERVQALTELGGHQLVYTQAGQTADQYIERFVRETEGDLFVASNDGLVQVMVSSHAVRLSASDLQRAVKLEKEKREQRYIQQRWQKEGLSTLLSPEAAEALENLRQGLYEKDEEEKEAVSSLQTDVQKIEKKASTEKNGGVPQKRKRRRRNKGNSGKGKPEGETKEGSRQVGNKSKNKNTTKKNP